MNSKTSRKYLWGRDLAFKQNYQNPIFFQLLEFSLALTQLGSITSRCTCSGKERAVEIEPNEKFYSFDSSVLTGKCRTFDFKPEMGEDRGDDRRFCFRKSLQRCFHPYFWTKCEGWNGRSRTLCTFSTVRWNAFLLYFRVVWRGNTQNTAFSMLDKKNKFTSIS